MALVVFSLFLLLLIAVQGQLQESVTVQCFSSAANCNSNTNGVSLAAIDCCNRTGGGCIRHSSLAAQCGACVVVGFDQSHVHIGPSDAGRRYSFTADVLLSTPGAPDVTGLDYAISREPASLDLDVADYLSSDFAGRTNGFLPERFSIRYLSQGNAVALQPTLSFDYLIAAETDPGDPAIPSGVVLVYRRLSITIEDIDIITIGLQEPSLVLEGSTATARVERQIIAYEAPFEVTVSNERYTGPLSQDEAAVGDFDLFNFTEQHSVVFQPTTLNEQRFEELMFFMSRDNIVELQEVFRWRLTVNDSRVRLDPQRTTQIVRLDNQDVFSIGFKDVNVAIREGEFASLTIKQIGDETAGADIGGFPEDRLQPVQLELILGTATNGSDFLINFTVPRLSYSVNNTLNDISFTPITSIDDDIFEGKETIKVIIVPVGDNVQAQKDRQTATITIIDNNIITTPPESVTVLLNEGGRANFTCEGTGDVLRWTVEGLPTDHSLNQRRGVIVTNTSASPVVLSSVISVTVLPINDGVNITCQMYSISNPFDLTTSTSTLTIQGISSVEDIQWSIDDQLLSWSPLSFYSDNKPQGAIATYNVLVNGISVTNTTDTSVWLNSTALNISCKEFDVSVTVSIAQYVSLGTVHSFNNTANYTVFYESLLMNYDESNATFSANLTSLINSTQSCDSTIMGRVDPDEGIEENTQFIKANKREELFQYKMIGLKPCKTYTAVIDVFHYFIRGDKTNFTFSTPSSDVYDIIVSNENESVSVQCVYALLSTAEGCHVVFNDVANKRSESFNITGSGNTTISLSTSGHYTVTAYDILNGNIIPWSCVQPKQVTVVKLMPSPSSVRSSNELLHTLYSETVLVLTSSESPSRSAVNISPAITSTINSNSINSVVLIGSSVAGAVIVFALITIIIAVAAVVWHIRKTKLESKGNFMSNNPAYGQIQLPLQRPSGIKTDVNPAYETVTNNVLYETVF